MTTSRNVLLLAFIICWIGILGITGRRSACHSAMSSFVFMFINTNPGSPGK